MSRQFHNCKRIRTGFPNPRQHRVAARVQNEIFGERVTPVLSRSGPANPNVSVRQAGDQ
jgi:hypothetical protein